MTHANDDDQALRTARRQLAAVLVEGLGPTGIALAEQLIQLGIGTVLLRDERPVTAADFTYRRADLRRPRVEAACSMLQPRDGRTAVLEAPEAAAARGLDLHVIVADNEPIMHRLSAAGQSDSGILPVELTQAGFCIGPVLGSGGGACLQCLVLHGLADEHSVPEAESPHPVLGPSHIIAVGVAAHQVQLLVDGGGAAAAEAGVLFGQATTGSIGYRGVNPHPECRCLTYLRRRGGTAGIRRRAGQPYTVSEDMAESDS